VRTFMRFAVEVCLVFTAILPFASSSALGQGTNPFFTPPTFPGTGQMLSADVNGDGKPDLLFFDGTVLLGNGDGTFKSGTAWRSTAAAPSIIGSQFAIADFNGDGRADIFVIGPLNVLSVLLGNGDGTFQAGTTTSVASPPAAFIAGDLNGDGKTDVLAQVGSVTLTYLGKGDGTFAAGISSFAASPEVASAFADFNGDGRLDLIVPAIGIQLGRGDGTFEPIVPFQTSLLPGSNVIGDFDGDGKLDVIVTGANSTGQQLQVLFGNGDGTFRAGSIQSLPASAGLVDLFAADLNGDGKLDLVGSTGSAVQVFIGKGDGTFTPGNFYNAPTVAPSGTLGSTSIVITDFNGDKKRDVAAFNTMLLGNGDGTLQGNPAVPGTFGFSAMGDFNGDGHLDFASVGPVQQSPTDNNIFEANVSIWLNDGKNNFMVLHTYPITLPFPDLADTIGVVAFGTAADINGDGKMDLVGYRADSGGLNMLVLLGNGDGSFGAPIPTTLPVGLRLLQIAFTLEDVNGDGKLDLIVNSGNGPNPTTLNVLVGNGDGTFTNAASPFTGGGSIGAPVVGDFNNDKKLDIITGTPNGLAVMLGNGDGTFQPTTFITSAACGTDCDTPVSADLNGDGNLDLMVATTSGYQVLLGKGDGTFTISPGVKTGGGAFVPFQVADFNGDGNPDVLGAVGTQSFSFELVLGVGDGTFGPLLPVANAGSPFVADFNGDNQPDVLEVGANQLVFLNNSTGPVFSLSAGSGSATVAAGKAASYSLSLGGSGGFSGSVALTCSGAPSGATCTVSPSSVTLSGTTPHNVTVSIATTAASLLLPTTFSDPRDPAPPVIWVVGLLLAAGIGAWLASVPGSARRFCYAFGAACCALLLVSVSLLAGCGGSKPGSGPGPGTGGATGGTATGTYAITVTATAQSRAITRTIKLTLIVQ
jgi:hypothetical protein